MPKRKPFVVVGIDLAGSPRRPTGICLLRGLRAQTLIAFSDEDILNALHEARPDLVPIDAPLCLPQGRRTIHDRAGQHFRECDLELRRRGIRFFPITLGPMRMLTERGLALKAKIRAMGYHAIECYPGAAQDLWGIPRQHQNRKALLAGLRKLGVRGLAKAITSDELDAVTAALVGRWLLLGWGEMLGGEEGIAIPVRKDVRHPPKDTAKVVLPAPLSLRNIINMTHVGQADAAKPKTEKQSHEEKTVKSPRVSSAKS